MGRAKTLTTRPNDLTLSRGPKRLTGSTNNNDSDDVADSEASKFADTDNRRNELIGSNQDPNFLGFQSGIGIFAAMLIGTIIAPRSFFSRNKHKSSPPSSPSSSPVVPLCSGKRPKDPRKNDDDDDQTRDKLSTDWDKAWSKFRKQGKKSIFSNFSPDKYVSWNPKRSDYPLSEEVDPIKRTERSNLRLWTSPRFTLVGAIIIVTFLLVYTILAPINK